MQRIRLIRPTHLLLLTFLSAATLRAQTITGTWQATTPSVENPRVALRISKASDGSLQGIFYRIGPTVTGLPSTVQFHDPDLNVVIAVLDTTYQARLSPDHKSFQGIWTQNKQSSPLTFTLATPDTLWKTTGDAVAAPMAAGADPAFDVATIKLSQPPARSRSFVLRTRHFAARNATVADMVKFAYSLRTRQIEAAPSWFDDTRFDIDATPDAEGLPSDDQDRAMLRKLLADRFQFRFHTVEKVFPAYSMTLGASHPGLVPSDPELNTRAGILTHTGADGQMLVQFRDHTMTDLTEILMNFFPDRHVVDETGLEGRFDFSITIPDRPASPDMGDRASDLLHALQELGFKLTPKKISLKVSVIDHVEAPSAN